MTDPMKFDPESRTYFVGDRPASVKRMTHADVDSFDRTFDAFTTLAGCLGVLWVLFLIGAITAGLVLAYRNWG